jgi:class 3 adenylate cyclase/tetratricopeptide (TPR) repeat protein
MVICSNCGSENPSQFKLCGFCGTVLPVSEPAVLATPDERKTVTIVFTDLVGSTSLGERIDPEVMSGLLNRYFQVMTAILERHGGSIQKFIGDAIVAVFGIPQVHEDDALRAVRAAHEMQLTLARLNEELERTFGTGIEARIGINTGEIVVGDAVTGQQVVTGDTANVAARLEQAAPAMGVYVGGTTYRLVRDAVEVEAMEPLELKGKTQPVAAYRLVTVHGTDEGVARRVDTPLVGRTAELGALQATYRRALDGQRCHAVTLLGDAGVGKSRLIREFIGSLGDEARVIRGRVLSYGEGITFWPLAEVVRDAASIDIDAPAEAALDKLKALVGEDDVVDRLASAIGLTDDPLPVTEIFWGARRFLEILARDRPVVMVIDDIHWAEPTFLDLLEHLTEQLEDARVVVVATARHELLETRPSWGQAPCSTRVILEGLTDAESGAVVTNLLGEVDLSAAVRGRIVRAAGGNPLFVEQMLSMLIDDGLLRPSNGSWEIVGDVGDLAVPPTIQALLAARLDRLARDEHAVLDPASVIGVEFPTPAVHELSPEALRDRVGSLLESMTTKQLVRPTGSVIGEYRFNHQLIRDTTYQSMLKRGRAQVHERYADWLEAHEAGRLGEVEEVIGYHLEQAHRYRLSLGPLDEPGRELGRRAAAFLDLSGRRAFAREDMHAAIGLLRRSIDLRQDDSAERRAAQLVLADALDEVGAFTDAASVLEAVEDAANQARDEAAAARARLLRIRLELASEPGPDWNARALAEAERALPIFEAADDPGGSCLAWRVRYLAHATTGHFAQAAEDAEKVIQLAGVAGDERQRLRGLSNLAIALTYGPTPAAEAANRLGELSAEVGPDRWTGILLKAATAQVLAMQRQFDDAQALVQEAREGARGLGQSKLVAELAFPSAEVDLRAGAPELAESALREATAFFEGAGETYMLASVASLLGRALVEQGRLPEATFQADRAASLAADDDFDAQARCRGLRSAILLAEGDYSGAVVRAEEALSMARSAEMPMVTAMALSDLVAALMAAGDESRAAGIRDEARALFAAKGDLASADRLTLSHAR